MIKADLIVVGAGPAGMAAARRAALNGLSVLLLDEHPAAGGQIYRNVEKAAPLRGDILGKDYTDGLLLTQGLAQTGITHLKGAAVWQIEEGSEVAFTQGGKAALAVGRRILLATGALERPMPLPGWTLPGVMTAGAAQILLKQSGVVCQGAVLVGSGPLLYLVAHQMVKAGAPPLALVETRTWRDEVAALRHLGGAVRGWRVLAKGLQMLWQLRRSRIRRYTGATELAVEGPDGVRALCFRAKGKDVRLPCETVLLHHGVVPDTQAARSVGIPHKWNIAQNCFAPEKDGWGRTPVKTLFVAGDGAGIGGAKAAALSGEIAALAIAADLGRLTPQQRDSAARTLRAGLDREQAVRPFIDRAFPPYGGALLAPDDTIICRCEEVTAGEIRGAARLGCLGPNQTKAFCRAGMGPCQGRYCGLTVTQILSDLHNTPPDKTGYLTIRPPLKPVTLGEIAALSEPDTNEASP